MYLFLNCACKWWINEFYDVLPSLQRDIIRIIQRTCYSFIDFKHIRTRTINQYTSSIIIFTVKKDWYQIFVYGYVTFLHYFTVFGSLYKYIYLHLYTVSIYNCSSPLILFLIISCKTTFYQWNIGGYFLTNFADFFIHRRKTFFVVKFISFWLIGFQSLIILTESWIIDVETYYNNVVISHVQIKICF